MGKKERKKDEIKFSTCELVLKFFPRIFMKGAGHQLYLFLSPLIASSFLKYCDRSLIQTDKVEETL